MFSYLATYFQIEVLKIPHTATNLPKCVIKHTSVWKTPLQGYILFCTLEPRSSHLTWLNCLQNTIKMANSLKINHAKDSKCSSDA